MDLPESDEQRLNRIHVARPLRLGEFWQVLAEFWQSFGIARDTANPFTFKGFFDFWQFWQFWHARERVCGALQLGRK